MSEQLLVSGCGRMPSVRLSYVGYVDPTFLGTLACRVLVVLWRAFWAHSGRSPTRFPYYHPPGAILFFRRDQWLQKSIGTCYWYPRLDWVFSSPSSLIFIRGLLRLIKVLSELSRLDYLSVEIYPDRQNGCVCWRSCQTPVLLLFDWQLFLVL